MWPRDLIQLPTQLASLTALLREQNSLLRELIHAHTHQPAKTPTTIHSLPSAVPPFIRQQFPHSADDVFVVSRDRRADLDRLEQERRQLPWRDRDALESIHQQDKQAPRRDLPPT